MRNKNIRKNANTTSINLGEVTDHPSEEFVVTANSLGAHIETHSGLIFRTLRELTVNSQEDSHCELSMSLQLTP